MSLRAYARHRGVSLRAVQKALASGRISAREDGRLDADVADADWIRNTAPRPQHCQLSQQRRRHSPQIGHHHTEVPRREPSDPPKLESGLEYSKARAVREGYQARLTKLDYEERSGKLVSADEVQVAAFNRFRQFRDGMLNIPDRLAAVLAAEGDPGRVHELLVDRDSQSPTGVRRCQRLRKSIRNAAAAGARPDPLLTVSEWADSYRTLSQRASAEPGPWRTERTPYLREIMDCLSPSSAGRDGRADERRADRRHRVRKQLDRLCRPPGTRPDARSPAHRRDGQAQLEAAHRSAD